MSKSPTTKSTIKNDPFATVIPMPNQLDFSEPPAPKPVIKAPPNVERRPEQTVEAEKPKARTVAPVAAEKRSKQKLTVHLNPDLADRVKNAAYWNPKLTIAGIAEQGIWLAIEKHEREHGGKYPPREAELAGGRPIK